MGKIEADIALKGWLFGFRPCSGQGQFTLPGFPVVMVGSKTSMLYQTVAGNENTKHDNKYIPDTLTSRESGRKVTERLPDLVVGARGRAKTVFRPAFFRLSFFRTQTLVCHFLSSIFAFFVRLVFH